jgi:hypothetical protein
MARYRRVEYPGALSLLTARDNNQQTIAHRETDRTDFLTGPGQEVLPATLAQRTVKPEPHPCFRSGPLDCHVRRCAVVPTSDVSAEEPEPEPGGLR